MMTNDLDHHAHIYCSLLSNERDEPLFGTAGRTDFYVLIEYRGKWGLRAFEESDLQGTVKEYLISSVKLLKNSKILLIRSTGQYGANSVDTDKSFQSDSGGGIWLYVAAVRESDPSLYQFRIDDYKQLLDLDFAAIVSGQREYQTSLREKPLFLVCTHGRRDACCSKFGIPVYRELFKLAGGSVWQSSHMGGHRFATNVICLPQGVMYGRVDPEDAAQVIQYCRRGEVNLEILRGRTCYDQPVQVAEYYLRGETGRLGLADFVLERVEEIAPSQWSIHFRSIDDGRRHNLGIAFETTGDEVFQGCTMDKSSALVRKRLVNYNLRGDVS